MAKTNWINIIDANKFSLFLKEKLNVCNFSLEKRFDIDYGTYFAVYSDEIPHYVMFFGDYGKISAKKIDDSVKFVDDFEFLDKNQKFMMDFVSFIHNECKVDGKCLKINNKTYINDFNYNYNNYLEAKKEKGDN